jgi:hypothetical protein
LEWALSKCIARNGAYACSPGTITLTVIIQAYKHVFTSPSSVDQEPKATRSGNAQIHGMTKVTPALIANVATQVRTIMFTLYSVFTVVGSFRVVLFSRVFADRHNYGFQIILLISSGFV